MKTEEIQARLERGYTMAIYGTRENIHEQMTNDINELLEAINYTHSCETLKEISKIVDKIVEETPLLCMPDDKQMQRDYLKEKWTNWFKKEYNL